MGGFGQSYLKITLEPKGAQNLGSLLMKLSQSNFNLSSPDSDLVSKIFNQCFAQLRC
jgi:hypothetical protein